MSYPHPNPTRINFECGPMQDVVKADSIQIDGTHYKDMPMQPWTIMEAVLTHSEFVGYLKGSILKYALRDGKKPGAEADAKKALHYKQKLAEVQG